MSDTHWDSSDMSESAQSPVAHALVVREIGNAKTTFMVALFDFLMAEEAETLTNQHFSDLKRAWER